MFFRPALIVVMDNDSSHDLESVTKKQPWDGLELKSKDEATLVLLKALIMRIDSLHDLVRELKPQRRATKKNGD